MQTCDVRNRLVLLVGFTLAFAASCDSPPTWGQVDVTNEFRDAGKVFSAQSGRITLQRKDGSRQTIRIQDTDERAVSLEGGRVIFSYPAQISVTGTLPLEEIPVGSTLVLNARLDSRGRQEGMIDQLTWMDGDAPALSTAFDRAPEGREFGDCRIVGRLARVSSSKISLEIPDSKLARNGKLTLKLAPEAGVQLRSSSLRWIQAGDRIDRITGVVLSTGDRVAAEIAVTIAGPRRELTPSFHEQLSRKFSHLSNEPARPRDVTSDHFILHTDLSDRSAQILLAKLERMFELVGKYYGGRPREPIECFVVRDLKQWSGKLPAAGAAKIAEGAGVTMSRSRAGITRSVVFSCDRHEVVQHEAVHAFCNQLFGSAGPVWYAEGMAEMGQYWRPDALDVDVDPVVIEYLSEGEQKSMREIVLAEQITGDSWRAYAWRWALCHLLANNPNYAARFRQLGINLMTKRPDSFYQAFGNVAEQISFEYDQFKRNLGNGYRVDLCAWDWKTKGSKIDSNRRIRTRIESARGWQASGLEVQAGVEYEFVAEGTWQLNPVLEGVDADGAEDGSGRLLGVVLTPDYELVQPLEMGSRGKFTAEADGQLFLRCDDLWTELADNEGSLIVHFRRTPQ